MPTTLISRSAEQLKNIPTLCSWHVQQEMEPLKCNFQQEYNFNVILSYPKKLMGTYWVGDFICTFQKAKMDAGLFFKLFLVMKFPLAKKYKLKLVFR